jgi:hypothetical protein
VGDAHAQRKPPRPGRNGGKLTDFAAGVSGNPGGVPAGFIRLSQAYAILGEYTQAEIKQIAEGEKPKRWGKRPLYMPYVKAARMWLGIENVPSSVEIADRTEGKVKSTTDLNVSAPDLVTAYLLLAKKRGLA